MTEVDTPTDWFCNGAVHDMNGDIVVAGGTDAYPLDNGGTWRGSAATYRYGHVDDTITRLGDMSTRRWYPNLLRDERGDLSVHGGVSDGTKPSTWEVLHAGSQTWDVLPWRLATVQPPSDACPCSAVPCS